MVYDLAVTGRLTEQLPVDGSAVDLLRDLAKVKAELIRDGLFKRSVKLENLPFEAPESTALPGSWCWSRLVDVGEINPRNDVEDATSASFVPMSGVPQIHAGAMRAEVRRWAEIKKGFTHFAGGDVIVAKITPCFENGKAAIVCDLENGVGTGSTELHVVRPIQDMIEAGYIYLFLRSPLFKFYGISSMAGTAGQQRLPTEYFATRAFPLPPRSEQKRIVAKVDELMALCDELEAKQQKRERLRVLTSDTALDALIKPSID